MGRAEDGEAQLTEGRSHPHTQGEDPRRSRSRAGGWHHQRTYVSPLREKAAARTRALILQHSGYEQAMRQILALRTPEAVLKALAQGTRMGNEGQFTVHEAIRKAHRGGHSRPAVVLVRPHRLAHLGDRERLVVGSGRERPLPNGSRHSLRNPGIHGMLRHPTPAEGCTG
ncbi:hypothetical protein ACWDSL_39970 [Streptomyces sp. NPDC000941]